MKRIIKANFLAGLLSGLVAPVIWPVVIFFVEGKFTAWPTYPMAALAISFFAVIIGLTTCVVIGSPVLLVLEKFNLNTPAIAGTAGFILALLIYFLFAVGNSSSALSQSLPVVVFFAIMGTFCGATASALLRTNKLLVHTHEKDVLPD